MLAYERRQAICAAIEAQRPALVDAVLVDFYRNPFWDERYGERGRQFARQDNHFHLDFLTAAIRTDNPGSLADYYRWLQTLLVNRGMCTHHILQNLDFMQRHLSHVLPLEWAQVESYHRAGYAGLAYAHPACAALAAAQPQLAAAVTAAMLAADPFWEQQFGARGRALCLEDNLYHLSYLQDAVGAPAPHIFGPYVEWLSGFLSKRGLAPAHLHADLSALSRAIVVALGDSAARPFVELLAPYAHAALEQS